MKTEIGSMLIVGVDKTKKNYYILLENDDQWALFFDVEEQGNRYMTHHYIKFLMENQAAEWV